MQKAVDAGILISSNESEHRKSWCSLSQGEHILSGIPFQQTLHGYSIRLPTALVQANIF